MSQEIRKYKFTDASHVAAFLAAVTQSDVRAEQDRIVMSQETAEKLANVLLNAAWL